MRGGARGGEGRPRSPGRSRVLAKREVMLVAESWMEACAGPCEGGEGWTPSPEDLRPVAMLSDTRALFYSTERKGLV